MKVLLVDDSATNLEILRAYLTVFGHHTVDTAYCAMVAETQLGMNVYDVMIFDYLLARSLSEESGTGLDLLRWCRKQRIPTPCIILSAVSPEELKNCQEIAAAENLGPMTAVCKLSAMRGELLAAIRYMAK